MEYYSAIKRNEMELFIVRWMDLESVIQSEVSEKEKDKYDMLTHIYGVLEYAFFLVNSNPSFKSQLSSHHLPKGF